jgi:thiol-disulfide isomerase/thioredoxin
MNAIRTTLPALLLFCSALAAQSSVAEIQKEFERRQREQMLAGGVSIDDQRKWLQELAAAIEKHLKASPDAADRDAGILALAHCHLGVGERDKAKERIASISLERAPALVLMQAAELAARIGMRAESAKFVDAAVTRKVPLAQRMEIGRILLTSLHDPVRGEAIFTTALAEAKTDEERAEILWHQAETTREREDLLEADPYDKALEELGKKYPETKWGSIAKARHLARGMKVGSDAVPLAAVDVDGKPFALKDYAGKVVLLDFWASWNGNSVRAMPALKKVHERFAERGFVVIGINLDEDRASFDAIRTREKLPWRQVFEGKGLKSEAALRFGVEAPALYLVGKDGKIAAMNLFPADATGLAELEQAVERALGAK